MFDALYTLTIRIAAMSVLCALMECLIPQGKLKKTVQLCMGVVFVLSIASSIVSCADQDLPALFVPTQAEAAQPPAYEELLRGYYEDSLAIDGR